MIDNIFDLKLSELCQKYDLITQNDHDVKLREFFKESFNMCKEKKYVIWNIEPLNYNEYIENIILNNIKSLNKSQSFALNDFCFKQDFDYSLKLITKEEFYNSNIEIVILPYLQNEKNHKHKNEILKMKPNCIIIDLSTSNILKKLDINNIKNISLNLDSDKYKYQNLFDLKIGYENENNELKKEEKLKKLISAYFRIRDFYYTEYFINEYIMNRYKDSENYKLFLIDIKKIIGDVFENASLKTSKDIAIFYIDALSHIVVYDDKRSKPLMLKKYFENGVYFTNAYSTAATSFESLISIFKGKYSTEEFPYGNFRPRIDDIKFINIIQDYGYEIYLQQNDNCIAHDDCKLNLTFSEKLWNIACNRALNNKPCLYFVHTDTEIHAPTYSGFHSVMNNMASLLHGNLLLYSKKRLKDARTQLEEAEKYIDVQFDYYYKSLTGNISFILFSDHARNISKEYEHRPYWCYAKQPELSIRVPLLIVDKFYKPQIINSLFSMINFNELIMNVFHKKNIQSNEQQIIRYIYYPIFNTYKRKVGNENNSTKYINGMDCYLDDQYIYISCPEGDEVFDRSDINSDISKTQEGQRFINKVKNIYVVEDIRKIIKSLNEYINYDT